MHDQAIPPNGCNGWMTLTKAGMEATETADAFERVPAQLHQLERSAQEPFVDSGGVDDRVEHPSQPFFVDASGQGANGGRLLAGCGTFIDGLGG